MTDKYLMPYFTSKTKDIEGSCTKINKIGQNRNPWTGRWLRKNVRGKLKRDCETWQKREKSSVITYWRNDKEYLIESTLKVGELLGHGKYWTVYSHGPHRVIKLRVLWSETDYNKTQQEKKVYRLAANHKVGPAIYDWYYVTDAVVKTASRKVPQKKVVGVAVAIVERFASEGSDRIRKTTEFSRLKEKLKRMEAQHGIAIEEPFVNRNLLVNADETDMVAGDLGNWIPTVRNYSLSCTRHLDV